MYCSIQIHTIHTHKSMHMCMYCMYFVHIVCMLWYILCISLLYCMYCLYFLQPKVLVAAYAHDTYNTYIYIHIHTKYITHTYKNTCKYMHIHAFWLGCRAIHIVCMCMYFMGSAYVYVCMVYVYVSVCICLYVCKIYYLCICTPNVHMHSGGGVQSAPFAPLMAISYAFRAQQSCPKPRLRWSLYLVHSRGFSFGCRRAWKLPPGTDCRVYVCVCIRKYAYVLHVSVCIL